jgi:CHAT domain-containing protein/predicted negative regulator of RcsB-dependent stress response
VTRPNRETSTVKKSLREIAKLRDKATLRRYLSRRRGLQRVSVVWQLVDASRTNLRVDARQALSLAEAAVAIARRLGDREAIGGSLRSKANALYVLGSNESALECHSQALLIFQATQNAEQEARTLNSSIQPLILLGAYDRALAAAARARKLFRRLNDQRHLGHLEINTGNIYHRQDRFEEALSCYERAYDMLLPLRDSEGLAVALYDMSVCLISLNDFPRALATYQRSRKMCIRHGMKLLVGQSDYNIAYLYYLRGEYSRAIEMLRATRQVCEENGDAHILALCYLDLSDIYLELNLSAEANEVAREGFLQFEKLGMGYERAKCLTNQALALGQQGKAVRALDLLRQARTAFVNEKNDVWPWLLDLYCALVLFEQGRLGEARTCCQKALTFFQSSTLGGKAVLCRLLLARIELETGSIPRALEQCEEAMRQLATLEFPLLNYQAAFLMGQVHAAAGDSQTAYSFYQRAREGLEALRSTLHRDELKIAFMKNRVQVYECLVEICLSKKRTESSTCEAFEYIETAKSRSLLELILQESQASPGGVTRQSALSRRIRDLREELNWYYHRIEQEQLRFPESSQARIDDLQTQANTREKNLLRALRELPQPESRAVSLRGFSGIPFSEIQSGLSDDTLMIEYFALGDQLIAAVLGRHKLEILPVTLLSRAAHMIQLLRFQLSKLHLGPEYARRFERALFQTTQAHLEELYRELLEPIRDHLQGQHLIFVPHGVLHSLPFHALFDGKQYLIDRSSVSYAPSASIYRLCQDRPKLPGNSCLILGIPDERAPSIRDEVSAVGSVMKSHVFSGEEATEETLRKKGANSRIVHIATHGKFRKDNPMFSGIRLGQSYLSLFDLYQLRLRCELITLSGCGTGLNVVAAGDELLGLVRGLLGGGARSLLLTLWDVHDQSTTQFMKEFYGQLQAGSTKARACQSAMRTVRDLYSHPYYWAPFFLTGEALGR